MGGGAEDLNVDPDAVRRITTGLSEAIGELGDIGDTTGSEMGKGFSHLAMTGMEAGHHGLSVDFEDYCERWEWGVRALVQDANTIASKLGLAAGLEWQEDQYLQTTFKVGLNSLIGDPAATEDELAKKSWGDVAKPGFLSPDYSAKSFEDAGDEAAQTWKDTGRSLLTEGSGGQRSDLLNHVFGVDQQQFDQAVDDAFGPSPEERAQQHGDGGGTNRGTR